MSVGQDGVLQGTITFALEATNGSTMPYVCHTCTRITPTCPFPRRQMARMARRASRHAEDGAMVERDGAGRIAGTVNSAIDAVAGLFSRAPSAAPPVVATPVVTLSTTHRALWTFPALSLTCPHLRTATLTALTALIAGAGTVLATVVRELRAEEAGRICWSTEDGQRESGTLLDLWDRGASLPPLGRSQPRIACAALLVEVVATARRDASRAAARCTPTRARPRASSAT